ncbi:MAG: VWA domain-containing protein, partial [Candidatus Korobacteraceae bacterium]
NNVIVRDLSAMDIQIKDKGRNPASITLFQPQVDLPLRLGIVIDVSDSISSLLVFEQEAAVSFIKRILDPEKDTAFVVAFNRTPRMLQEQTSDSTLLLNAFAGLQARGGTALYDAVIYACRQFEKENLETPSRRVLLVISDGEDNESSAKSDDAMESALATNTIIMTLNIRGTPRIKTPWNTSFAKLAETTGGLAFPADSQEHISKAFGEIETSLRSQYLIAYKPSKLRFDRSFRKIEIKSQRKGIRFIHRKGYFSPGPEHASN